MAPVIQIRRSVSDDARVTGTEGLGQRVRRLRVQRGLSQADLAREGLSASYVSLIEAGKRAPTLGAVEQLAETLGSTVEYLRDGIDRSLTEEHRLALNWAELALYNGAPEEALERAQSLLADDKLAPDTRWRASFLVAQAQEGLGELEQAIARLEVLRDEAEQEPKRWPWLSVVVALCRCYREAGDLNYSISLAESVLAKVRELGLAGSDEHAELASTLIGSYYERGDLARASQLADELLQRTSAGSARAQAAAYWNASIVAHEKGRGGDALKLAEKAIVRMEEGGNTRKLARVRLAYAALLLRQDPGEPTRALHLLDEVRQDLAEQGSQVDLAYADTEAARAYLQLGDSGKAAMLAHAALNRLGDRPRLETARALALLGQAFRAAGDTAEAAARLRHAAQLLDLVQAGKDAAPVWRELGDVLLELGDQGEAIRAYQRSLATAGVHAAELPPQPSPSGPPASSRP
jgi:transcriptional regulator with XRE-family HTH domain